MKVIYRPWVSELNAVLCVLSSDVKGRVIAHWQLTSKSISSFRIWQPELMSHMEKTVLRLCTKPLKLATSSKLVMWPDTTRGKTFWKFEMSFWNKYLTFNKFLIISSWKKRIYSSIFVYSTVMASHTMCIFFFCCSARVKLIPINEGHCIPAFCLLLDMTVHGKGKCQTLQGCFPE